MSDTLFDLSPYKSASAKSYHSDYRDATTSDPAWDETELYPSWKNSTAEPSGDAEYNSTKVSTMAAAETSESSHATVEVVEELSLEEEADRQRLELKVERAFYEAGSGLRELRDRRLYRSTHRTFEEYCRDMFGFQRRHSYQLIEAASVVDNLCANGAQSQVEGETNTAQILPTSERQVRPLTTLAPDKQCEVWQQAVEEAGGKIPSGRAVNSIVARLQERDTTPPPITYKPNDVFLICSSSGALRKYYCCWAIAIQINEYTVSVRVHDGDLTVQPENLQPIDSPSECQQVLLIAQRLARLRQYGLLDRGAYYILEGIGRQTYLTEVEEGLLSWLENHYGVV